jgi:hypothetical protein
MFRRDSRRLGNWWHNWSGVLGDVIEHCILRATLVRLLSRRKRGVYSVSGEHATSAAEARSRPQGIPRSRIPWSAHSMHGRRTRTARDIGQMDGMERAKVKRPPRQHRGARPSHARRARWPRPRIDQRCSRCRQIDTPETGKRIARSAPPRFRVNRCEQIPRIFPQSTGGNHGLFAFENRGKRERALC